MDAPPVLNTELVKEFVGQAHGNLDKVREMLEQEPKLLNAANDWGGAEWGAAAHMGRKDIALFLLGKGGRMDIFAAAMLGRLDVVKGIISVQPEAATAPGPHGIPLIAHAKAGESPEVVAYLESL